MIDGNILVWIESADGDIYPEYEYKEPRKGRKECWIESKQSTNFRICWRFSGSTPHNDESTSTNPTDLESLNTIRVAFEYVTFVGYTFDPPTPPKSRGAIYEKIAKTTPGDSAGLGDPIRSPLRRWCKTEKVPGLDRVQFVFHYAPYEWLLAREVVSGPKLTSPEKRKSPEKSRSVGGTPSTPRKRKHTVQALYISDSDSDVVVVDEGIAETPRAGGSKPPSKRRRSTPSKPKTNGTVRATPVTPSKPRPKSKPKPKPNRNEDVIDLASSEDDFEIQ